MKALLVWKDGRTEPTDVGGGIYIVKPHQGEDDRYKETTFEMTGDLDAKGRRVYVESGTKDVNASYRESQARKMVFDARQYGIALPHYVLQGRYPGETDEEFERRREILKEAVR